MRPMNRMAPDSSCLHPVFLQLTSHVRVPAEQEAFVRFSLLRDSNGLDTQSETAKAVQARRIDIFIA